MTRTHSTSFPRSKRSCYTNSLGTKSLSRTSTLFLDGRRSCPSRPTCIYGLKIICSFTFIGESLTKRTVLYNRRCAQPYKKAAIMYYWRGNNTTVLLLIATNAFWTQNKSDPICVRLSSASDSPPRFLQIISPLFWREF
jgi:hypothetical protein